MSVDNLTKGDIVFNEHGQRFVFIAESDGEYICRPTLEADEEEPWEGSPVTLRKVFASAPREMYDKTIEALDAKVQELQTQKRALEEELRKSKQDETERKKRIMVNAALERIDDCLAGKFTHLVLISGNIRIETFDKAVKYKNSEYDKEPKEFRLLSLFGKTNGDLAWKLSYYSDGSGSSQHVYPCVSLEQAQGIAKGLLEEEYKKWRSNPANLYIARSALYSAVSMGLSVPEDLSDAVKRDTIENAAKLRDSKNKEYLDAVDRYHDAVTKTAEELAKGKK